MNQLLSLSFVLIVSIFTNLQSQENLFGYPDPVLPDSVPRIFAPGLISLADAHEEGLAFSPDGNEILFTREMIDDKDENHSTILQLKRKGNSWSPPRPAPFTTDANDSEPAFGKDGKRLYFFSERRKPGITSYIGEIWVSRKYSGGWGRPTYPQNILNETWINSISSTQEGRLYFSSYRDRRIGIFYSDMINGKYREPVFLPPEINSVAGANRPFITPNDNILVFEGKSSGYDYSELYISFKTSRGIWEPAKKMNSTINKTKTETNPSLSPDGKYLFFTRNGDIYWIKIEYVF